MALDPQLAEPPVEERSCGRCGNRLNLTGKLLHHPYPGFEGATYTSLCGCRLEPWSHWVYHCTLCRAFIKSWGKGGIYGDKE